MPTRGGLTTIVLGAIATLSSACGGGGGGGGSGGGSHGPAPAMSAISADGRFAVAEKSRPLPSGERDIVVTDLSDGSTTIATLDPLGNPASGDSFDASISGDGRYVVFQSSAPDLVPGSFHSTFDVFRRDLVAGVTEIVSSTPEGDYGLGTSGGAAISYDGRFVAFVSTAGNLVDGDTNGVADVFVRDMDSGVTTRVSIDSQGAEGDGPSGWPTDVFGVIDRPSLSADGLLVAFSSRATNLVSGDTNDHQDVFVHDMTTGETTLVSVGPGGTQANWSCGAPSLSADAQFITFISAATDLVPESVTGHRAVYRRDLMAGETLLVSVDASGSQGHGDSDVVSVSGDGRLVAFDSDAPDLTPDAMDLQVKSFVHDCATGDLVRLDSGAGLRCYSPTMSSDGHYVVFLAYNDVTDDDYRMYVTDLVAGTTRLVASGL